ncbi:hypothetical protein GCM10027435_28410 [Haloparvum alkalitolerans]
MVPATVKACRFAGPVRWPLPVSVRVATFKVSLGDSRGMVLDFLGDEDALTWRRAAIIGFTFIALVVLAGVGLVVFRGAFEGGLF